MDGLSLWWFLIIGIMFVLICVVLYAVFRLLRAAFEESFFSGVMLMATIAFFCWFVWWVTPLSEHGRNHGKEEEQARKARETPHEVRKDPLGCTVMEFEDGAGHQHYYTVCPKADSTMTSTHQECHHVGNHNYCHDEIEEIPTTHK